MSPSVTFPRSPPDFADWHVDFSLATSWNFSRVTGVFSALSSFMISLASSCDSTRMCETLAVDISIPKKPASGPFWSTRLFFRNANPKTVQNTRNPKSASEFPPEAAASSAAAGEAVESKVAIKVEPLTKPEAASLPPWRVLFGLLPATKHAQEKAPAAIPPATNPLRSPKRRCVLRRGIGMASPAHLPVRPALEWYTGNKFECAGMTAIQSGTSLPPL
mmetsp:Transcript_21512/g.50152  ORF Transcript_21512/g.50152 Transcript_21512/m.50152 type:complete len:219 (+) Transcript_21512:111-767(+)